MSTRQTQPAQPAHQSHPCSLSLCRWTREAGPGRRGRSERSRTEGCMRRTRLPNSTGNLRGPSGTQTQQRTSSELLASPEDKPRIRPDELFKIQHSSKYILICLQEYVAKILRIQRVSFILRWLRRLFKKRHDGFILTIIWQWEMTHRNANFAICPNIGSKTWRNSNIALLNWYWPVPVYTWPAVT